MKKLPTLLKSTLFLGLFLLLGFCHPKAASAQGARVFIDQSGYQDLTVGEEVVLPVIFNSEGEGVDGVQVGIQFSESVGNPELNIENSLDLQTLSQSIDEQGLSVMFIPIDLMQNITITEDTQLFNFSFTPLQEGEITISFVEEETLSPSSETSENIIAGANGAILSVHSANYVADDAMNQMVEVVEPAKQMTPIIYVVVVGVAVVILGGIIFLFIKKKKQNKQPEFSEQNLPDQTPPENPLDQT
jgi:hypothetical protein